MTCSPAPQVEFNNPPLLRHRSIKRTVEHRTPTLFVSLPPAFVFVARTVLSGSSETLLMNINLKACPFVRLTKLGASKSPQAATGVSRFDPLDETE